MQIYPALRAKMGFWDYYIVKMRMKEVASEVSFAHEVYDDPTLNTMIQRSLDENRARDDILQYLLKRDDRFFGSIVVAAIGGEPTFQSVSMENIPELAFFQGRDFGFGILQFDGDQKYYALDGQHRLKAIKSLVSPDADQMDLVLNTVDENRLNEEVSVLIVMPGDNNESEGFLTRYRRLFSSLNRYAKSMDEFTIIAMDEDDVFAILTRRLVGEHDYFKSGSDCDYPTSFNVKDRPGKTTRTNDQWFIPLEGLYAANKIWLMTPTRETEMGWGVAKTLKQYLQYRPDDEEEIDSFYDELEMYWSALFEVMPELGEENLPEFRQHNSDIGPDMLYFWPIGLEIVIHECRQLLNEQLRDVSEPTKKRCVNIFQPLKEINFEMHNLPWRNLILVKSENGWKMRSQDRGPVMILCQTILYNMLRPETPDQDSLDLLRNQWEEYREGSSEEGEVDDMWEEIKNLVS